MPDQVTEISPMHVITASETVGIGSAVLSGAMLNDRLTARIQYINAMQASGSGVWTFTVQVSYNAGATWTTVATGAAITLTATAQDGEQSLSFNPSSVPVSGRALVQVLATLTGTPVTPTLAYRADLLGGASG
jgi:hypothetical protein